MIDRLDRGGEWVMRPLFAMHKLLEAFACFELCWRSGRLQSVRLQLFEASPFLDVGIGVAVKKDQAAEMLRTVV